MRGVIALAVVVAALVGCGSDSSAGTSDGTSLSVTFWPNGPQDSGKRTWTLRCNPASGTLARPAAACRRLAAGGADLFTGLAADVVCTQIYGGPQTARVTGMFDGERVTTAFSRANGCEISRWDALSPWLLPRGGVTR